MRENLSFKYTLPPTSYETRKNGKGERIGEEKGMRWAQADFRTKGVLEIKHKLYITENWGSEGVNSHLTSHSWSAGTRQICATAEWNSEKNQISTPLLFCCCWYFGWLVLAQGLMQPRLLLRLVWDSWPFCLYLPSDGSITWLPAISP